MDFSQQQQQKKTYLLSSLQMDANDLIMNSNNTNVCGGCMKKISLEWMKNNNELICIKKNEQILIL